MLTTPAIWNPTWRLKLTPPVIEMLFVPVEMSDQLPLNTCPFAVVFIILQRGPAFAP